MPYWVWKRLHRLFPNKLPELTSPVVEKGYHPTSRKRVEGVVLDKSDKCSYDTPVAYCVIVLLEMLSKIVERIIANRLSVQACELGLIHPNQCGLLSGVSTFHAAVSLNHKVVIAQKLKLKVSSLFLDIKGGFDNIRAAQLTSAKTDRASDM